MDVTAEETAPEMTPEEYLRFKKYGGVLAFMHWAMTQPEGKTKSFGELLILGCKVRNLPHPEPTLNKLCSR